GLNESLSSNNDFRFWDQFTTPGTGGFGIVPNLPADSPWKSVGDPVLLTGVDVTNPGSASWNWTVRRRAQSQTGHYCMVVFAHSRGYSTHRFPQSETQSARLSATL